MKETFSNNLKLLRKQKQLSQEQLAEQLGITTQAVSKWECSLSYPDIDLLPQLADLFGVSIDALLRGDGTCAACAQTDDSKADSAATAGRTDSISENDNANKTNGLAGGSAAEESTPFPQPDLPDDDVLRIVQYRGKTLLRKNTYNPHIRIPLSLTCEPRTKTFLRSHVSVSVNDSPSMQIEIWGSADIFGDVNGSANVGQFLNCSGDINGDANAKQDITCSGDINGDTNAKQDITCSGDINGNANAGRDLSCDGDINGNASANGDLSCDGDISGDASANGDLSCDGDISGDASAGVNLSCDGDIDGDASANGDLSCDGDINGDATAGRDLSCDGDINGDASAGGDLSCDGDIG